MSGQHSSQVPATALLMLQVLKDLQVQLEGTEHSHLLGRGAKDLGHAMRPPHKQLQMPADPVATE
eukprot:725708-Lingulodinium_polyedra.AAC.1